MRPLPLGSGDSSPEPRDPVRVVGLGKRYGGIPVLTDVSIEFRPGEVHVLAGENGAGKSTLIRILAGAVRADSGHIQIGDRRVRYGNPAEAARDGIAVIHQELSLVQDMSVADNLLLGAEPSRFGFRRDGQARTEAQRLLDLIGIDVDLDACPRDLPLSMCQLIEVAKALRSAGRLIVLDEPTSALNAHDAERLFAVIERLKAQGRIVVYISHRMEEIRSLADRISVLRDGRLVGTYSSQDLTDEALIGLMVGGVPLAHARNQVMAVGGPAVFAVTDVTVESAGREVVAGASLSVGAGEVVGVAGLQGAGATELMQAIFGSSGRIVTGNLSLEGKHFQPRGPRHSIAAGISFLTNDRKTSGLVMPQSVTENATLVALPTLSPGGWRRPHRELKAAGELVQRFHIRAPSLNAPVAFLSGGNQQKVALAKWTLVRPKLLLLDEPTRGIDVGAKREIYALIQQWKAEGLAILLITSELPELLDLSDRIVVMHRGRVIRTLTRDQATAEAVLQAAMGSEAA